MSAAHVCFCFALHPEPGRTPSRDLFCVALDRKTVYRLKQGLLDDYLCQQLKNPSVKMRFA